MEENKNLKNENLNNNYNGEERSRLKIKNPILKAIFEWIYTIVVALAIALIVNNLVITNSLIPTGSMESTLPVGSRVFGSRLHYLFGAPKRGDIVVIDFGYICKNPDCKQMYQKIDYDHKEYLSKEILDNENTNYDELFSATCPNCGRKDKYNSRAFYIKRCIALPGDKVEIKYDYDADTKDFKVLKFKEDGTVKAGHVYINGEKQEEVYINEPMIVDDKFYKSFKFTVPEGAYFLLGDNRNNSDDARFWKQMFIPKKQIISKAGFIYWPFNKLGFVK